ALLEISVGAGLERHELALGIHRGGEQETWGLAERLVAAHATDHLRAADPGQNIVDDEQVGAVRGCEAQAFLAARREQYGVTGALESLAQLLTISRTVVDHEHGGLRAAARAHPAAMDQLSRAFGQLRPIVRLAHIFVGARYEAADTIPDLGLGG